MRMQFNRELFSPQELKEMYSLSPEAAAKKAENDRERINILVYITNQEIKKEA